MNILILDTDLQQISIISSFKSLVFNRCFNSAGSFEIAVNMNAINAEELKPDRIIYLDPNRCGMIEKVEVSQSENSSNEIIIAKGIEMKDLIGRRVIVPPAGSEKEEYISVTTEGIVRGLLSNHIISPTDTARTVSIFELGSARGIGSSRDYSARYKALDTEVYQLLSDDGLGLAYSVDLTLKKVYLTVNEGIDRTAGQTTNPTAIIALKLGTADKNIILHDRQSYKNIVYAGGQGEGVEREVMTLPSASQSEGILRRELFLDARDVETQGELISRGNTKLSELNFIFQVNSTANKSTDIEYDLGDKVTILDYRTNAHEDLQLTGITDTYYGGSPPQKSLVFGRAPLSIAQAINSRLSGLSNILTI